MCIRDRGCFSTESVNYPVYGEAVANAVVNGEAQRGVLICGTEMCIRDRGGWELDSCGPAAFGCTDFACSGQATKDGKTIVGQNFDWYPNAPTIVERIHPKGKPSYLTVTWPGHLAQVGLSESGFGMFINLLLTKDNGRVGVPYAFICNKILYQKNVPDAIRAVTQSNACLLYTSRCV